MNLTSKHLLQSMAGAAMAIAFTAFAQAPATPAPAPAAAPAAAAPAAPADAPTPLSTFVLTGPLQWLPPAVFDAGPFGKLSVNGIVTGFALGQNNPIPTDDTKQATLSNGEIFIQKADGKVQYYIQAGAYTMPTLSVPFLTAQDTVKNFYGPVPVAYLKLPVGKNTQFLLGSLPTLMGAESTFTYQNFNIERGIVWNQENAVNRGIQINQTLNKYLSASVSWNDGYYSNRYSWISGSATLTKGPHSLVYDGMGNLGQTVYQTAATPIQNNGYMHAVIYTYTKGPWIISPYFQYGKLPTNATVGVTKGTSATGGAINVSYAWQKAASRFRFALNSSRVREAQPTDRSTCWALGRAAQAPLSPRRPPIRRAASLHASDLAYVHASNSTAGDVFGKAGTDPSQFRAVGEFGFIFGSNIAGKNKHRNTFRFRRDPLALRTFQPSCLRAGTAGVCAKTEVNKSLLSPFAFLHFILITHALTFS